MDIVIKLNPCLHKSRLNENILVPVGKDRLTNQLLSNWNSNTVGDTKIRQIIQKPSISHIAHNGYNVVHMLNGRCFSLVHLFITVFTMESTTSRLGN